ncbi:LPS export ABC transporter periplasmic protein LptC [Stenotrophomonas aracearum]|jgi:lipopolysaccharide export system protein LptC|uniref:Lipopolysaccharide export system protein LptC n=1 Tax=Stenotrophomonas aracearum TaxID=3003272 RepID=A0ABY9YGU6_9GAMM|nr:LPS export ABC transporter periplasmic protein LptC [Stenotrophomonas sp. A5588]WNH49700.1 LPS export ABC transporter periplasmic protein LptC [Stenotrophomonas sp. A5588]
MNLRTALGGLLLVAAVLSGWALLRDRDKAPEATGDDASRDYVLHDFEIVALDEQGRESTTLRAPLLERTRSDETMTIQTPLFLLPDRDGNHWELRSDTGWVSANGETLRLTGNVSGDSPRVPTVPPTTFRTEQLDVFPNENRATSDGLVTLTRPGMIQSGVGFALNSSDKTYQFLSQVKTRYTPRQ